MTEDAGAIRDSRRHDDQDPDEVASTPDLHPVIDPREPTDGAPQEVPPLDVDQRDSSTGHVSTPEVIELAGATPEWAETAEVDPTLPGGAQEIIDAHVDSGDTATLPTPPDVAPDNDDFVELPIHRTPPDSAGTPDAGPADESVAEPETPVSGEREPPAAGPARGPLGGIASRLGIGRGEHRKKGTEEGARTAAPPPGRRSSLDRVAQSLRTYFDPRLHMFSTEPHRWIGASSLVLIFAFLLANSGGLALIVTSAVFPLLILVTLTQHDVFEKESSLIVAGVAALGVVVGIVLSALASWIQGEQWFDTGVLNYGASGFGGRFAEGDGAAPVVVWLLVGLAIPALALACFGGIPIALRRWPQFRNEVMDGVILGGATATGYAVGASIVYWWPMIADPGPLTSVSDWTLSVLGVAVLRPVAITLCGTMIGAGVWRYMINQGPGAILTPAIGGIGGYLLLTFGSIQLQSSGIWPEFLWTLLVLAAIFILYRKVLDQAVADDRLALGDEATRIVCPACHKVTPAGQYCAHCGQALRTAGTAPKPPSPGS